MIRENDYCLDIKQDIDLCIIIEGGQFQKRKKKKAWVLLPETVGMDIKQVSTAVGRFLSLLGLRDNQAMLTSPFSPKLYIPMCFNWCL